MMATRNATVVFRTYAPRKAAWQTAAKRQGKSLSAWLEDIADVAAARAMWEQEAAERRTRTKRSHVR